MQKVTNIARKMQQNRLNGLEIIYVEYFQIIYYSKKKKNHEIVKKINEIKVQGNQRKDRPKKWLKVIREDIMTCDVDEDMVKDRERWRGRIQIVNSTW